MADGITLRAFREDDLGFLGRLCTGPAALGPFEWAGFDGGWRDTVIYALLRGDR